MEENPESLRYPIGKFQPPSQYSATVIEESIVAIEKFPHALRNEVIRLSGEQLDTPYRPGGWSIRQVVHHCADSHLNALLRFKLALTEETPEVKPYNEKLFAELPDSKFMRIDPSLDLLEGLHKRWASLLRGMSAEQFSRTYFHPEHKKAFALNEATAMYAWHCNHHLAHIRSLKARKKWL